MVGEPHYLVDAKSEFGFYQLIRQGKRTSYIRNFDAYVLPYTIPVAMSSRRHIRPTSTVFSAPERTRGCAMTCVSKFNVPSCREGVLANNILLHLFFGPSLHVLVYLFLSVVHTFVP